MKDKWAEENGVNDELTPLELKTIENEIKAKKNLPYKNELTILKKGEYIKNPFTNQKAWLTPEAVAVYDLCMGANQLEMWQIVRDCISWFREYYPKEYLILLD